jgi:hypothetical protein
MQDFLWMSNIKWSDLCHLNWKLKIVYCKLVPQIKSSPVTSLTQTSRNYPEYERLVSSWWVVLAAMTKVLYSYGPEMRVRDIFSILLSINCTVQYIQGENYVELCCHTVNMENCKKNWPNNILIENYHN